MHHRQEHGELPGPVNQFLDGISESLRRRKVTRARLTPLLLRVSAEELVQRRKGLFVEVRTEQEKWGVSVSFRRKVRPTPTHPEGRMVGGRFALVSVTGSFCLLVSTLGGEANASGPFLLCTKSHPLAKRPFFTSAALGDLVDALAEDNGWNATTTDAMGYDRDRSFRRDTKPQSIQDELAEWGEQDRFVHRLEVSFSGEHSMEVLRASFDRNASVTVSRGDVGAVVTGFVLPAVTASASESDTYNVQVTPRPQEQQVVQLTFRGEPFVTYENMRSLCDALRKEVGLAVTVIHLNPYLQAQVVDMFTGAAADMVVLDKMRVSLIPRSQRSESSLERITATLFRYFGEGQVARVPIS